MWIPPVRRDGVFPAPGEPDAPSAPSSERPPITRAEWTLLLSTRANVLVVGSQPLTDALLSAWLPHLREPIYWWSPGTNLAPGWEVQTVILDDVSRLMPAEQSAVIGLIVGRQHRFISLSRRPVYDLVLERKFADDLYYLLNSLYLRL